jgi:hypothetical protein
MFRRTLALLAVLPVLVSAGPATTRPGPSTNRAEPQYRVEAATTALVALEGRLRAEKDMSDEWMIEQTARWSKRLMLAELDVATNQAQREEAAENYLQRVQSSGELLLRASRHNVGRFDLAAANYHVTEAKEILACIRTGKPLPSTCD